MKHNYNLQLVARGICKQAGSFGDFVSDNAGAIIGALGGLGGGALIGSNAMDDEELSPEERSSARMRGAIIGALAGGALGGVGGHYLPGLWSDAFGGSDDSKSSNGKAGDGSGSDSATTGGGAVGEGEDGESGGYEVKGPGAWSAGGAAAGLVAGLPGSGKAYVKWQDKLMNANSAAIKEITPKMKAMSHYQELKRLGPEFAHAPEMARLQKDITRIDKQIRSRDLKLKNATPFKFGLKRVGKSTLGGFLGGWLVDQFI